MIQVFIQIFRTGAAYPHRLTSCFVGRLSGSGAEDYCARQGEDDPGDLDPVWSLVLACRRGSRRAECAYRGGDEAFSPAERKVDKAQLDRHARSAARLAASHHAQRVRVREGLEPARS